MPRHGKACVHEFPAFRDLSNTTKKAKRISLSSQRCSLSSKPSGASPTRVARAASKTGRSQQNDGLMTAVGTVFLFLAGAPAAKAATYSFGYVAHRP
jgi:hypothetical protein